MIAVLGAGSWGTAIASLIARNSPQETIVLWGRNEYKNVFSNFQLSNNIKFTTNLISAIADANYLIIAVPSNAFSDLINKMKPYIDLKQHTIIWATKGLDSSSNKFFNQIINDLISKDLPIAMLSGPSFAKEVIDNLPTEVEIVCEKRYEVIIAKLINKLHSPNFKVYISHDLIGAQLGGIFKNILAVAIGIVDGLRFGANIKAALITRGLSEIMRLANKLGAKSHTLLGLSGIGDIFLTCTDNQSRNRKFGRLLANGVTISNAKLEIGQSIEALYNIEPLYRLAESNKVDMPIVKNIWRILNHKVTLNEAIDDILEMTRLDIYNGMYKDT